MTSHRDISGEGPIQSGACTDDDHVCDIYYYFIIIAIILIIKIRMCDSSAVSDYIEAVREVACELLELMAEGLGAPDPSVFSRLIRDADSDSIIRLNHYPPMPVPIIGCKDKDTSPSHNTNRVGFGEHSDPQILTLLRSNDVGGLQISLNDGVWVPVSPDPNGFCVNVGDVLQVGPFHLSLSLSLVVL